MNLDFISSTDSEPVSLSILDDAGAPSCLQAACQNNEHSILDQLARKIRHYTLPDSRLPVYRSFISSTYSEATSLSIFDDAEAPPYLQAVCQSDEHTMLDLLARYM